MPGPTNAFAWGPYDVTKGWSQGENVAAKRPGKFKQMRELPWAGVAKYQALPLGASVATRLVPPRPNVTAGQRPCEKSALHSVAG
jgi:arylsulfatase